MAWEDRDLMSMKREFVSKAVENSKPFAQLCREYRISRKTGYKWLSRFKKDGVLGLIERPRIPFKMPTKLDTSSVQLILNIKEKYPFWGVRKLKQVLINEGHSDLPCESTFSRVLKREEMPELANLQKRKTWIRFEKENPNELWQMDFKGHFLTEEGRCFPLTVLDDCSRYSICIKACTHEDEKSVRNALEESFRTYGLPESMTMDNGNPWKGSPGMRFSKLTIWLMRLGVKVGHSSPYHPQTQGKDERFHRSLKEELLKYHNFKNLFDAQKSFDEWRGLYNNIRPHEALKMACPAKKYYPSLRRYPDKLEAIEYEVGDEVRNVAHKGEIKFKGRFYFLGEGFRGERVAIRQRSEKKWDIYYAKSWLGAIEV